ncbi:MAG: GatB/YqeY domain-containing protein, partial [Methanoregulaceae archaeon]|nr:GatB/YqeY domain-containing protein [Methanoregulaceae archaeon]
TREYGFDPAVSRKVAYSEHLWLFEQAVREEISPNLASRTLFGTIKELSRDGVDTGRLIGPPADGISIPVVIEVMKYVEDGSVAKEAVPDILKCICSGIPVDEALLKCSRSVSDADLASIVRRIVEERKDFVKERGKGSLGPLMGIVMAQVRGSVDGKAVSTALRREIDRVLAE